MKRLNSNWERIILMVTTVSLVFLPWYSSLSTLRSSTEVVNNDTIRKSMQSNGYGTLYLDNYTPSAGQSALTNVSEKHLGMIRILIFSMIILSKQIQLYITT